MLPRNEATTLLPGLAKLKHAPARFVAADLEVEADVLKIQLPNAYPSKSYDIKRTLLRFLADFPVAPVPTAYTIRTVSNAAFDAAADEPGLGITSAIH